jgi:hypothetical protein
MGRWQSGSSGIIRIVDWRIRIGCWIGNGWRTKKRWTIRIFERNKIRWRIEV